MTQESMPRLFGSDGIRGEAVKYPLDAKTLCRLGRVLGELLTEGNPIRVLIGGDTRESSPRIASLLAAGLREAHTEVTYAGVITTPAAALLTRQDGFHAGVMISASHHPYHDNGIKIFSPQGTKLDDSLERKIEEGLQNQMAAESPPSVPTPLSPPLSPDGKLRKRYVDYLAHLIPAGLNLSRIRLVIDCANGAASEVAPLLAETLKLNCFFIHRSPDGENINRNCGSLYPEQMAQTLTERGADLGVALDGDADRAIFSTQKGRVTDGDGVLWLASRYLKQKGKLAGDHVVGTVMTNYGLEQGLRRQGIRLTRTAVGDKNVLEEMHRSGAKLGGEPSGHVIFSDFATTGDGLVTFLMLLRIMAEEGKSLGELVADLRMLPQVIQNVGVKNKPPLDSVAPVRETLERCEEALGTRGRIVLRYSGTEPLVRVMVEAEDEDEVNRIAEQLAESVRRNLS
ncbi:MAG: phosphoglucosamine mutase [Acidobacteria bacterium]|nr:phosphoglucosamine mutase [Acidobacteriota bacterium]